MGLDLLHVKPSEIIVNNCDYFTMDEFETNRSFILKYIDSLKFIKDEDGNENQVLYFIEKGYQRKGMNESFYKIFQNEKLYFEISDVQKALTFINPKYNNEVNLFKTFQKDFIDNFIEGESIFFASW